MVARETFRQELAELEATLQEQGALVVQALEAALTTFRDWDRGVVDAVARLDHAADERYLTIERSVESIIARQTPVAGDLRIVLGVLYVNRHLKRMARNSVRVATFAEPIEGEPLDGLLGEIFTTQGVRAAGMARTALAAFARRDVAAAASLASFDVEIDADNRRALERVLECAEISRREWGIRGILMARALERFGDHAVAIGDQAAYVATGEHRGLESARAERG